MRSARRFVDVRSAKLLPVSKKSSRHDNMNIEHAMRFIFPLSS